MGRARSVSEVPATGRPPGRRNLRRVDRSVGQKKNTRPAAPADPHAHFKRVGHIWLARILTPDVFPQSGRPAFSLRTCTPRSGRNTLSLPTCFRRTGLLSFSPQSGGPRSVFATFSLYASGRGVADRPFHLAPTSKDYARSRGYVILHSLR